MENTTTTTITVELWPGKTQEFMLKYPNLAQCIEIKTKLSNIATIDNATLEEIETKLIVNKVVLDLLQSPDRATATEVLENFGMAPLTILKAVVQKSDAEIDVKEQEMTSITYKITLAEEEMLIKCRRISQRSVFLVNNGDPSKQYQTAVEQLALACDDKISRENYNRLATEYPFTVVKLADKLFAAASVKLLDEKKNQ